MSGEKSKETAALGSSADEKKVSNLSSVLSGNSLVKCNYDFSLKMMCFWKCGEHSVWAGSVDGVKSISLA